MEDVDIVLQGIAQMKYGGTDVLQIPIRCHRQEFAPVLDRQRWERGLVITADTGMENLAFGIPVLVDAVLTLRNENKTMSQLIMYPRWLLRKTSTGIQKHGCLHQQTVIGSRASTPWRCG